MEACFLATLTDKYLRGLEELIGVDVTQLGNEDQNYAKDNEEQIRAPVLVGVFIFTHKRLEIPCDSHFE